jgi:hypothetical protein
VYQGEIHVPCRGRPGRSGNVSKRREREPTVCLPVRRMPFLASHISSGRKEMEKAAAALKGSVDGKSVGIPIRFYMPDVGVMS